MDAIFQWEFWAAAALLFSTIYVQFVGHQIEKLSGIDRLQNPEFYRGLFGGAPWVQWPMYRYGGVVQVVVGIAVFVLFGWKIGAATIIAVCVFCLVTWRVARGHAAQMLADLARRIENENTGEPRRR